MAKAPGKRIIVAVDATTPVRPYLQAAAELALLLQAELHILFLINEELKQLAELPFAVEVTMRSRDVRSLSPEIIERDQRLRSRQAQTELERLLQQKRLRGSFQAIPGLLRTTLFKRRKRGDIVWISRDNPLQFALSAPRFKYTLYVVYRHSTAGKHTLALAQRLRSRGYRRVIVFVPGDLDLQTLARLGRDNVELQILDDGLEQLLCQVENSSSNSLLIPDDAPLAQDRAALLAALADRRFETLIVR
jgi:hypothetical protein